LTGAAEKLITELEARFPSSSLMDALGFVYPQYWLGGNAEEDFDRHLAILKDHYGRTKKFAVPPKKGKKGRVPEDGKDIRSEDAQVMHEYTSEGMHAIEKDDPQNLMAEGKEALPVLSVQKLDEQACMFKIAMKGNCHAAVEGDLPTNPMTRLWRRIEANSVL
jgi:hypothetical protein